MNEQMSRYLETTIKLHFNQVKDAVPVVPTDNIDTEELYEELIHKAQTREFGYLTLCSAQGDFQLPYRQSIQSLNPRPFVEALLQGGQRIAVGIDSAGDEVVLFGVDTAYPMRDGGGSADLIAAAPLEYITEFLFLKDEGQLMYYYIIRPDESFVIQNLNTGLWYLFEQLQKQLDSTADDSFREHPFQKFGAMLKDHKERVGVFEVNGEKRQIYGIPLLYSGRYLVSIMPYNILDDTINDLSS